MLRFAGLQKCTVTVAVAKGPEEGLDCMCERSWGHCLGAARIVLPLTD